jgi:hypothetical protein
MNKVLNFLCNIPLFFGLCVLQLAVGVKYVANKFFDLSFYLHVKAGTDIGKKIEEITEQAKAFAAQLRAAKQTHAQEDNKLLRIVRPDQLPSGVFQLGKKPTTDN